MSDRHEDGSGCQVVTRRAVIGGLALAGVGGLVAGPVPPGSAGALRRSPLLRQATPVVNDVRGQRTAIVALAREAMVAGDLQAVILPVLIDGEEIVTTTVGDSMTGVPATANMHL